MGDRGLLSQATAADVDTNNNVMFYAQVFLVLVAKNHISDIVIINLRKIYTYIPTAHGKYLSISYKGNLLTNISTQYSILF